MIPFYTCIVQLKRNNQGMIAIIVDDFERPLEVILTFKSKLYIHKLLHIQH